MSEEKKLTDEEIIEALYECEREEIVFYRYTDGINVYHKHISELAIDLIHRLQEENEGLKSVNSWLLDRCKIKDGEISEQKAEIERLTEEKKTLVWLNQDLKKQVDELTEKLGKVLSTVGIDEYQQSKAVEQAVKDTAKEILQWLKAKVIMTEIPHGSEPCEEDVEAVMWWQIEEHFKKKYGVEVE